MSSLNDSIQFIQGVGPKRAEILTSELNISTIEDMLYYFPFKYIDRTKFYKISELNADLPYIQIRGKILEFNVVGIGKSKRLTARFYDETGGIELVWFKGLTWITKSYKTNVEYVIFGKPNLFNSNINISHPEIEEANIFDKSLVTSLQPQYSISEKLKSQFITSKTFRIIQENIFKNYFSLINETIPDYLIEKLKLISLKEALFQAHFPQSPEKLKNARFRLKFEELFYIQLNLLKQKLIRKEKSKCFIFKKEKDNFTKLLFKQLPFKLTNAQIRVLGEIRTDFVSGKQMNRLLQGDVGSGKTLVALLSMLMAVDNGYQACIMAPTEILANQHYNTSIKFCKDLNITIRILTGSTKKSERKELHAKLQNNEVNILIGTHALIEDEVKFSNLGLVIIDEQHRFGVAQRARLWQKNVIEPHILVMTATPIPRTLAMTVYGDLDISVIDELPPGRKQIKTIHLFDNKRLALFGFLKKEIAAGRQVYVVFPLIKESEKLDYKDLEDGYEGYSRDFQMPEYLISVVHGKMKSAEKKIAMKIFITGKAQILISTTVIEVGVDVPNASVMVIESAERFGLSQLHQLRGRVGRGAEQSYCILMSGNKLSNEGQKRLQIMVETINGFEIADKDLELRGPGDIEGTQQSGLPFELKIADLGTDGRILQTAKYEAEKILKNDSQLQLSQNQILVYQLNKKNKNNVNWSKIS
ncbi:MAG: ATP-dependent DNA helicase RecG [Bacteroidetes bacterium CG02_land_8_20_14_3_00_31_25]|nr:MAG: ATP-dependent DNA helicase RecG [Bacteroidetes bacterium CG02_land_8_20_14_3_00_31_25]PIX33124.1 MAG: ATP-dependent DNA helicase RecG [Bacteroidetes bacterium CG_4_8_14_3_um_filter_31_14]